MIGARPAGPLRDPGGSAPCARIEDTQMMEFEALLCEDEADVARVTLNRPEVHNAFNAVM